MFVATCIKYQTAVELFLPTGVLNNICKQSEPSLDTMTQYSVGPVVDLLSIVTPIGEIMGLILDLSFNTFCPFKFCNHLDEVERAGCFALIVFLMYCDC